MWGEMARIIHEVRPRYVFVENSPMLTSRGLGRVLGDLASMGFDARWGVLGAADVGANHQRDRIWIVAKWRGQLPHAQHHRIRWWEQQQESIARSNGEASYSYGIGSQIPTNEQELEGEGGNQLQVEQPRDPSQVANARCELWDQRNSGKMGSSEEVGTTRSIFNQSGGEGCGENQVANSTSIRPQGQGQHEQSMCATQSGDWKANILEPISSSDFWSVEPAVGRVADGVAARVDRLKAIGNGQVPLCASQAFRILNCR
jgi:DNA (cytosine-5)-methyltransferase 1